MDLYAAGGRGECMDVERRIWERRTARLGENAGEWAELQIGAWGRTVRGLRGGTGVWARRQAVGLHSDAVRRLGSVEW